MAALGVRPLQERIKTIGLYRNKAKNVIALSQKLIAEHGGEVPREREALRPCPASAARPPTWCSTSPSASRRWPSTRTSSAVAHRLGLASGKTPHEVELGLLKVIPAAYLHHAHHWLILHGRYVCQARRPKCDACVVCDLCSSEDKWFDCGRPGSPRNERLRNDGCQRQRVPEHSRAHQRARRGAGGHAAPGHRHLFGRDGRHHRQLPRRPQDALQDQGPHLHLRRQRPRRLGGRLTNVLSRGDTVLALASGRFARGWGEMATMLGVEVEVLEGDWRRAVDPAEVEERSGATRATRSRRCWWCRSIPPPASSTTSPPSARPWTRPSIRPC
jgi:hypothetical protein